MVLSKKRLTEIANVICYQSHNYYRDVTTVKVTEANAGPHTLLSVKINLDLKEINVPLKSCFYSTTGIQNVMRDMFPDKAVKVDDFSIAVFPEDLYIDFFIWIK